MKQLVALIIAIIFSLVLATLRIAGHKGECFQAVAHLWVAGIFAWGLKPPRQLADIILIGMAIALSLIELACFLVGTIR